VKTAKRGCNSSWTTAINTLWYVCYFILFCKLLFSWIEYDNFFFNFQETYNSRLRERYEDDLSTHSNFDPDLWMEVGSFGGPDKNKVYGLFNTTTKNLWAARSVSTIKSSKSVPSTQFEEFMAWNNNTSNSRRIMNKSAKWSWTLDHRWVIHMRPLFGCLVLEKTSLLFSSTSTIVLV
jgi:hypothetical protein